jgi:hypothetical protein
MMLAALDDLAQREHLVDDPDYEKKKVDFFLRIDAQGTFLGLIPTRTDGGRAYEIPVPRFPKRSSGVSAGFLFDNAKYVLGLGGDEGERNERQVRSARPRARTATSSACPMRRRRAPRWCHSTPKPSRRRGSSRARTPRARVGAGECSCACALRSRQGHAAGRVGAGAGFLGVRGHGRRAARRGGARGDRVSAVIDDGAGPRRLKDRGCGRPIPR